MRLQRGRGKNPGQRVDTRDAAHHGLPALLEAHVRQPGKELGDERVEGGRNGGFSRRRDDRRVFLLLDITFFVPVLHLALVLRRRVRVLAILVFGLGGLLAGRGGAPARRARLFRRRHLGLVLLLVFVLVAGVIHLRVLLLCFFRIRVRRLRGVRDIRGIRLHSARVDASVPHRLRGDRSAFPFFIFQFQARLSVGDAGARVLGVLRGNPNHGGVARQSHDAVDERLYRAQRRFDVRALAALHRVHQRVQEQGGVEGGEGGAGPLAFLVPRV